MDDSGTQVPNQLLVYAYRRCKLCLIITSLWQLFEFLRDVYVYTQLHVSYYESLGYMFCISVWECIDKN